MISNQARSTTPAPLHSIFLFYWAPIGASTLDLTRRYAPRPAGALRASVARLRRARLTRRCAPRPTGALAMLVRPNRLRRFVESSLLTAGVLPAALRAASRFKIAPGDFVDHSGTSPLSNLSATPGGRDIGYGVGQCQARNTVRVVR